MAAAVNEQTKMLREEIKALFHFGEHPSTPVTLSVELPVPTTAA